MQNAATDAPIRDAASIVLIRGTGPEASVLMGQRGKNAAFMPEKFVFPGGAVDEGDALVDATELSAKCRHRLAFDASDQGQTFANAAIRELWEESGLRLATPSKTAVIPPDWASFCEGGFKPNGAALTFFFRAITPPARPRRFDARFFIAPASAIQGDPDDFAAASDELSNLQWVALSKARDFPLPFVTEVVLAEVAAQIQEGFGTRPIPYFKPEEPAGASFLRID